MTVVKLCGVALLCVATSAIIRKYDAQIGKLIIIIGALIVLCAVVTKLTPVVEFIKSVSSFGQINNYLGYLLKTCAVVLISEYTAEICRESDAVMLERAVVAFGRAEILIITLPLFGEVINFAVSLCQ